MAASTEARHHAPKFSSVSERLVFRRFYATPDRAVIRAENHFHDLLFPPIGYDGFEGVDGSQGERVLRLD